MMKLIPAIAGLVLAASADFAAETAQLTARGIVTEDHKSALRHVLLVSAGDGHQIAFSLGEIAPDFDATPVMLAYEMNGAAIPDGLRMVVPGDMRGARHIKDVVPLDYR